MTNVTSRRDGSRRFRCGAIFAQEASYLDSRSVRSPDRDRVRQELKERSLLPAAFTGHTALMRPKEPL